MKRNDDVIELGTASIETKGLVGTIKDYAQGQSDGLTDD